MGKLVISRHGESEWNLLGKWTGWTDVGLTEKGYADTVHLGKLLQDIDYQLQENPFLVFLLLFL